MIGMLLAAAIVLIGMVIVGRGVTNVNGGNGQAKTGSQKAYDDLKKDGDMDNPNDVMKDALKGNF